MASLSGLASGGGGEPADAGAEGINPAVGEARLLEGRLDVPADRHPLLHLKKAGHTAAGGARRSTGAEEAARTGVAKGSLKQ